MWSDLDDIALRNEESAEYKHILAQKGQEEVDRRIKFLGLQKEEKLIENA